MIKAAQILAQTSRQAPGPALTEERVGVIAMVVGWGGEEAFFIEDVVTGKLPMIQWMSHTMQT